jgi:glycine cleavage system aminomethyltransferase T
MPETRSTVVEEGYNGIMAFTPDDFPILGPARDVDGFWVAEGVWVTQSAGVGLAMAEWLMEGRSSTFSLHECELARFDPHQLSPQYIETTSVRHYVEIYDVRHPLDQAAEPRGLRTSPFHQRQQELGAVFFEGGGWERPQWYESNRALLDGRDLPSFTGWTAQNWSPVIGAEAQHTRENVALYDMTPLRHVEVTGPDAEEVLQELVTANVGRAVGSVTYCVMPDDGGGIRSDVTVTRLAADRFQVGANGLADVEWMRSRIRGRRVTVEDVTSGRCCIGVWGPRARALVSSMQTDIDFSAEAFPYFTARQGHLGFTDVTALRVSYVGELGWELYTTADQGLGLWDALMEAGAAHGVIAAGRGALGSLRLEKGYRAFGHEITHEFDPFETGLGFAVKKSKTGYIGEDALRERKESVDRRIVCLTHKDETQIVLGGEPVYAGSGPEAEDGHAVGYVTSAAHGYTVGAGVAYAWVPAELANPGQPIVITGYDRPIEAVVADEPLFDPDMTRVRS